MAVTQGERLARIETLLEQLPVLATKIDLLDNKITAEQMKLNKLQDRGLGLLIGVGLGGGAAGAGLTRLFERMFH